MGADAELQAHLAACQSCASEWKSLSTLRELGQQLRFVVPDKARRDAVQQRLIAVADERRSLLRPRQQVPRTVWLAAAAAAAAIALVVTLRPLPEGAKLAPMVSRTRAAVFPKGTASFVHERTAGDEWVRLSDGVVRMDVEPLRPGERFRVLCGDGEVEVRGTAFETVVEHDHLRRVYVLHGRVEVRPQNGPTVVLNGGERWEASAATGMVMAASEAVEPAPVEPPPGELAPVEPDTTPTVPPVAPGTRVPPGRAGTTRTSHRSAGTEALVPPAPLPLPGTPPSRVTSAPTPAESAFADGWEALRRDQYATAAASFEQAVTVGETEPIVEDARFWHAVALGRAGQSSAAAQALGDFIARHPGSPRLGEASSILGWQLLKSDQLDAADKHFQRAVQDARPEIRDSARAGLAAVVAQRAAAVPRP